MTLENFRQHLTIVAWINLIGGAIFTVVGIFVFLFFFGIGAASGDPQALGILTVIGTVGSMLLIVAGLPGLLAGWGLLQRRNWARILGIVVAVLNLFNVPIGTALGVYTLWVLTDENAASELS
jgi:hypothetical protein